jgi:hypothetical protein
MNHDRDATFTVAAPGAGLPIIAITPAEDGGFLATAMPQRQSDQFRPVEPPAEYRHLAQSTLDALWASWQAFNPILPDGYLELVFWETVGDPPGDGPKVGYQGFYSPENNQRILFIVTNWTPIEELARIVIHEAAHALHFLAWGDDGSGGPHVEGPSERFAEALADAICGPDPHPDALLGSGPTRALFAATFGQRESRAFLAPPTEPAALTAGRKGRLRKVRGLLAKAESTDSPPEAAALVSKARELVDGIGEGSITVINPGSVVIIDGTSNMLKIAATGWLATAAFTGPGNQSATVDLATGLTYRPVTHGFINSTLAYPCPYTVFYSATGAAWYIYELGVEVVSTNQTRVTVKTTATTPAGTPAVYETTYRYYVMKEVAF